MSAQNVSIDTLIVGGGVAGLSCARVISQKTGKTSLLLVSPDIGGRVCHSRSNIPYGAYWARKDYWNLKSFIKFKRRISLAQFIVPGQCHNKSLIAVLSDHPIQAVWLGVHIFLFSCAYWIFRLLCRYHDQAQVMRRNPLVTFFHSQNSVTYLKRFGLLEIGRKFAEPIARATALCNLEDLQASGLLFLLMLTFIPIYEFEMDWNKFIAPFAEQVIKDKVVKVTREGSNHWCATTSSGQRYLARSIVFAIPYHETISLIDLHQGKSRQINCWFWHIKGTFDACKHDFVFYILDAAQPDIGVAKQHDGSFLLYSRSENVRIEKYFRDFEVIHQGSWQPAFYVGQEVFHNTIGDGLYLAGDYNTPNMEDTFLNGRRAGLLAIKRAAV